MAATVSCICCSSSADLPACLVRLAKIYKFNNARHEHKTYIASLFISEGKNKESSDDEVLAIETVSSFASDDDDDVENESSSDSYSSESESDWTPNVEEFRGFPRMGEGEYDLALNFIVKIVLLVCPGLS